MGSATVQPAEKQQESAISLQQRSIAIQQKSVDLQRAIVGQASGIAPIVPKWNAWGASAVPNPFAPIGARFAPNCPPVSPLLLEGVVQKAAGDYGVSTNLINAVIHQESAGYPCAISDKGAQGLMQLMPATAAQLGVTDPFDISQNVTGGTRLLADLMQRYNGDLNRVLGAYNAGTVAVDRSGGIPPFAETINYIHSILEQIKPPIDPKLFATPIR